LRKVNPHLSLGWNIKPVFYHSMNRRYRILIFFLTFFIVPAIKAQEQTTSANTIPGHPRLLLNKDEAQKLLYAIESDSSKLVLHQYILAESERILTARPVERIKVGVRLLASSREAMLRIFYLSYSWRMTGKTAYLDRAKAELQAVAAFENWNPSHFLDVAEMTVAVAIGYDWLFDELSLDQRAVLRSAILEKGLEPSTDPANNWWLKANHNWNQVCNAGMVIGALAIYEDNAEYAQAIIDRARESIKLPMEAYGPDGAYPEGYMYWGYGTTFNVLLIDVLENAFSKEYELPQNSGFLSTAYYMRSMTGPSGWSFNYSDSDLQGGLQPAMFWFAQKLSDPSLLWAEKEHLRYISSLERADMRLLPLALIWGNKVPTSSIVAPNSRIWVGNGKTPVALMRSSWTDPNAIYIGLKGGSPSTNHSHMDIGSFIMEANGIRWALDFGRQDYQSLEAKNVDIWKFNQNSERWSVFRYSNLSHNTLTVNNKLQDVDGHAAIVGYSDTLAFTNAVVDLSALYPDLKKAKRGVTIIADSLVAIKDEFTAAGAPGLIRWTMLTSARVEILGKRKIRLTQGDEQLMMEVVGRGEIKLRTWSTKSKNSFDADNSGTTLVGYEISLGAGKSASYTVYLVPSAAQNVPRTNLPPLEKWNKTSNKKIKN
jgi:hypothetical protein